MAQRRSSVARTSRRDLQPDFTPAADGVIYAPSEELLPREIRQNPDGGDYPRHVFEDPFAGNENMLVRCVLVRSQKFLENPRGPAITSSQSVVNICRHMAHLDQEHMVVLALNQDMIVHAIYETAVGSVGSVGAAFADVLKIPMLTGCRAFVVVHNHPSGKVDPSADDVAYTRTMIKAAKCVDIQLLDHVIIALNGYYSFLDQGLIEKMNAQKF